jgi:hypothetical protein
MDREFINKLKDFAKYVAKKTGEEQARGEERVRSESRTGYCVVLGAETACAAKQGYSTRQKSMYKM